MAIVMEGDGAPYTTTSPRAGVVVVALNGDLDLTASDRLQRSIRLAESGDPSLLIFDLENVSFMDSTGVNALIASELRARQCGRIIVLAGLHQPRRTLEVAGVLGEFHTAGTVADALAGYGGASSGLPPETTRAHSEMS